MLIFQCFHDDVIVRIKLDYHDFDIEMPCEMQKSIV